MNEQNEEIPIPVDDELADLIRQADMQMHGLQQQINGALMYFMRRQGLTGEYALGANRRELVRAAQPERK
jgi:hypothetical protein